MAYVEICGRLLIGAVFLWAVAGKLRGRGSFTAFAESIRAMPGVPKRRLRVVAALTVTAEAAVPFLLLSEITAPAGLLLAIGLLAVFVTAIAAALRQRTMATCQCFGSAPVTLGRRHLIRNGLLVTVALAALAGTADQTPAAPAGVLIAVSAGLLGTVLIVFFDELVGLFAAPRGALPGRPG
ncbi:MauE/DoxX family redox-associated membrane protein [Actinoplanes derwentensis]|uniref:Methylamine utilisation protein MauE n=1 Tax=Actinoplanes derwentensis TaxID=113562 RepID=A0A1H1R2M8_9ACTN|nr:MauE/DoxX family redox-associated membrane protein [Actinoplanes derwentensis]GID87998.1 methylamine utilization protein MauE [Actinoplanes derwentensis]SDS29998.1 Methylamine utilisation protein MauE [Actinoplanes derwentensis]